MWLEKKKAINIQLNPMIISRVWQWAKDQGLPKQVAIERLIELGFDKLYENKKKEIGEL